MVLLPVLTKTVRFISWDPTNRPDYVKNGHNGIRIDYKGKGFGKKQLRESVKVRYSSHTYLKKCVEGIDIGLQGKIHDNQ